MARGLPAFAAALAAAALAVVTGVISAPAASAFAQTTGTADPAAADTLAVPDSLGSAHPAAADSLAAAPPGARDSLATPDTTAAKAPPDSLATRGAPPETPRPPLFAAYGALDTARADAVVLREEGVARGARTPIEPFREGTGVSLERFGFVGQSERLLVHGAEGVSLSIAGLPVLASRSGLAPLGIIPMVALRSARLRGPASDPLLGARGAGGGVDALISTEPDAERPPLTSLLAERGASEFRAYRVGLDRWVGPVRAGFAYQSSRNRLFADIDHTRLRETFFAIATPESAPVPFLVNIGAIRNEIDIVSGPGAEAGPSRGTEERTLVVGRSGFSAGRLGRGRVALKYDFLEWRARPQPALRGTEREMGGLVTLEGPRVAPPVSLALWGYAGRVEDEAAGRERGTERIGGTIVGEGSGSALDWLAYAGGERVSPTALEPLAGAVAGRALGSVRVEAAAYRVADNPPRALLLDGDALRPSRTTGASVTFRIGGRTGGLSNSPSDADARVSPPAPAAAPAPADAPAESGPAHRQDAGKSGPAVGITLLYRWVDDGIFLRASDPFFADPLRETYEDRGALVDAALPLVLGIGLEGYYLFLEDDADAPLPLHARHRGFAALARTWSFPEKDIRLALRAGCEVMGERVSFDRATPLGQVIDLRGQVRIEIESAVLFLQAENLLDRYNYVLPGLFPEGRSVQLGVTWYLND